MSNPAMALAASSTSFISAKVLPSNISKATESQNVSRMHVMPARASAGDTQATTPLTRRDVLLFASSAAVSTTLPSATRVAFAIGAPKGYAAREDPQDRYRFFYPFGWQEVQVKGQDVVFKDVIEPLESVAVNIIQTDKKDVKELGPAEDVAKILVDKVLTGPTQQSKLLSVEEKENNGKNYYVFEFVAAAPSYKRHALGVIAVANGKFYTLTTGSNERRWSAMEDKLRAVVNSFEAI